MENPAKSQSGISVIVCCYNSDPIKAIQTLTSIEKQQKVNFDVVLTDDGSTKRYLDDVLAWIHENHFSNITIVQNKKNKGIISNIFSALSFCRYPYIKVISPGDFLFDQETLARYLDCFIEENATMVSGNAIYYSVGKKIIPTLAPQNQKSKNPRWYFRNVIMGRDCFPGATLAYRKDFLEENLPVLIKEIGLVYLEDKPLTDICILNRRTLVYLPQAVIWYEFGSGISTSSDPNPRLKKDSDSYYHWLGKEKNRFARKGSFLYFNRANKKGNKLAYYFNLLLHPSYCLYAIDNHRSKKKYYETDVSKMDQMIYLAR